MEQIAPQSPPAFPDSPIARRTDALWHALVHVCARLDALPADSPRRGRYEQARGAVYERYRRAGDDWLTVFNARVKGVPVHLAAVAIGVRVAPPPRG